MLAFEYNNTIQRVHEPCITTPLLYALLIAVSFLSVDFNVFLLFIPKPTSEQRDFNKDTSAGKM